MHLSVQLEDDQPEREREVLLSNNDNQLNDFYTRKLPTCSLGQRQFFVYIFSDATQLNGACVHLQERVYDERGESNAIFSQL